MFKYLQIVKKPHMTVDQNIPDEIYLAGIMI